LSWDEGPDQGGPYGPYRQSERAGLYNQWAQRFLDTGNAYWCYCSPEELAARRVAVPAAGAARGSGQETDGAQQAQEAGYDRYCRTLTPEEAEAYLAEGRRPVLRFRMPDGPTTFTDLLRGEITVDHHDVPDFVLMRAGGSPLYTLAAPVDDVMMRITHIVRGEDLLSSTPRQIAVYRAMGLPEDQFPVFAHLSYVLGQDNQQLSNRNGVTSIDWYRQEGFLPEALGNYLALLGWSPGDGREEFTLDDLVGGFDLARVSPSAVRFDPEKLEAINGDKIRGLTQADFARRIVPFLARAGLVTEPLAFLLVPDSRFSVAAEDAAAVLTADAATPLKAAADALAAAGDWTAAGIEEALRATLVDGLGLEPGPAFAPVRVAVTGRQVSPALFESMALLGRDRSLARLAAAQAALPG
jgi:glutamyl-tRNA synthetase